MGIRLTRGAPRRTQRPLRCRQAEGNSSSRGKTTISTETGSQHQHDWCLLGWWGYRKSLILYLIIHDTAYTAQRQQHGWWFHCLMQPCEHKGVRGNKFFGGISLTDKSFKAALLYKIWTSCKMWNLLKHSLSTLQKERQWPSLLTLAYLGLSHRPNSFSLKSKGRTQHSCRTYILTEKTKLHPGF